MTEKYTFYCDCVSWPAGDVRCPGGLSDLIADAVDITRRTFLSKVAPDEMRGVERSLGYATTNNGELRMCNDWHVSYHRSKLHGKRVYFFKWSGIEHVFTKR